jgi:PAS domain S-box-containing protein
MTAEGDEGSFSLRARAANRLKLSRADVASLSSNDVQDLVHELQVHQIELEMQNEDLSLAQAEAETARRKYQELYDFAPVGYLSLTPDDIIVQANLMAGKWLGMPREELIGRKFADFVQPESRAIHFLHKRAVFRTHERQECQLQMATSEPLFLHVQSHAQLGSPHCQTVLSDITVMKTLEARLVEMAGHAQAGTRAKARFLAHMSHEIRTPLNAVIGLASVLDMTELDVEQKECVSVIRESADSLMTLLNDVLDLSRLESGALELEDKPFDLPHLLAGVQRMSAVAANARGLDLAVEYDWSLSKVFRGDAFRLRQVMLNLVSNAIKFTQEGSVRINVSGSASVDAGRADLCIRVIDTGVGVPENRRDAIFDSFVQADVSTARRYGGTGLGLAIARQLVHSMDGTIRVGDNIPRGAVFTVELSLPLAAFPADPDASRDSPDMSTANRRPRVLLVEDQPANILITGAYLERFGCEFDLCRDGIEAVRKCRDGSCDLVLIDIDMAETDGFATARDIRAEESRSGAPRTAIVAMSTYDLPERRQESFDSGMDDYLPQPFDPAVLQACLGRLTGK